MRLILFMTGQYRRFERSWENLRDRVIVPAKKEGIDVHVYIGMDGDLKSRGEGWKVEEQRRLEEDMMRLKKESGVESLSLLWIHRQDPHMREAVCSIKDYRDRGRLADSWLDYLVHRSGSCFEYAQFNVLLDRCIEEQSPFYAEDILMRTRTDIYLRHPLSFRRCARLPSFPMNDSSIAGVLSMMFPNSIDADYTQEKSIETSIINPHIRKTFSDRWIITLRKNLVYLLPLQHAHILSQVCRHYGDWDTMDRNTYWFNAESQFRGCLRHHYFAVVEYSQHGDEFHDGDIDSKEMVEKLPVYAILR